MKSATSNRSPIICPTFIVFSCDTDEYSYLETGQTTMLAFGSCWLNPAESHCRFLIADGPIALNCEQAMIAGSTLQPDLERTTPALGSARPADECALLR